MKVCPTDPTHNRFIATAHVTEDWVVDENGDFIELATAPPGEVVHRPDAENIWTCAICGQEAK